MRGGQEAWIGSKDAAYGAALFVAPGSEDSQRGRVAESPVGRVRPANPRFNDIVPFESKWLMDDGVVVEPPRAQAREG